MCQIVVLKILRVSKCVAVPWDMIHLMRNNWDAHFRNLLLIDIFILNFKVRMEWINKFAWHSSVYLLQKIQFWINVNDGCCISRFPGAFCKYSQGMITNPIKCSKELFQIDIVPVKVDKNPIKCSKELFQIDIVPTITNF